MSSGISQQEAAAAAKRIIGFYDTIPAADPKAFAAGLAAMLMIFSRGVVDRATDPVNGIAAKVGYLNLAAIRTKLDEWHYDEIRLARFSEPNVRMLEKPRDKDSDARVSAGLKELSEKLRAGIGPSTA